MLVGADAALIGDFDPARERRRVGHEARGKKRNARAVRVGNDRRAAQPKRHEEDAELGRAEPAHGWPAHAVGERRVRG